MHVKKYIKIKSNQINAIQISIPNTLKRESTKTKYKKKDIRKRETRKKRGNNSIQNITKTAKQEKKVSQTYGDTQRKIIKNKTKKTQKHQQPQPQPPKMTLNVEWL